MSKCEFCEKFCGNSWCSYAPKNSLKEGAIYTTDGSDLAFKVLVIFYENETKCKVAGKLFNKKTNIVYEIQSYELDKNSIAHWKAI